MSKQKCNNKEDGLCDTRNFETSERRSASLESPLMNKNTQQSRRAIIVVDMQNDFITGSLKNESAKEIIPFIKSELESGKYDGIFFTQDTHHEDYLDTQEGRKLPVPHCAYASHGWQIVDELQPFASDPNNLIKKSTFGWPHWHTMHKELSQFDEIVLCGTVTSICVLSNAILLKTFFPSMEISVLSMGVADITPEHNRAALIAMKSCQINII